MPDILASFTRVTRAGEGWTARCPGHEDARNSLSIGRGEDGRWLLKCHAGCTFDAILAAAHLELADLQPQKTIAGPDSAIAATFDYLDEHKILLFQVVRFAPKNFRQRRPDGRGGWIWNLHGVPRVVYRLPELQGRRTIFIAEGEKDVDALWALGLPATTNAGGAGKWQSEHTQMLTRAGCQQVIILPDNDPPGATHGRDVARSCVAANLEVKLIPLPDLPRKGDVSDYLARHAKADLLAIVKDAPLFNPARLVTAAPPLTLTSLADFLDEPDDQVDWVVEDRIPAGSVVLFVAPPKAGKSTAARELACAVSRGESWLGWKTTPGAVWLFVFEDKRSEVRKHVRRMDVARTDPLRLFIDQAPADLLPQLHDLAAKNRPTLIILDTLARALKVKDFNDYAEITQRFEPLLNLTRVTGATLLLLYHSSVHVSREGLDAVLGSTALSGSVDNILILKRTDQQRVLSSVQRIGPDLEPTVIVLNLETGRLERAGRKRDVDDADLGQRIVAALQPTTEPVTEKWLQAAVEGRNADKVRVLRRLLGLAQVRRFGVGGQKDPYRYGLTSACSHESAIDGGASKPREQPEQRSAPINSGLFDPPETSVPDVPVYSREQEIEIGVRTSVRSSSSHDPGALVPEVPVTLQKPVNGTSKTAELSENTTRIQVPRTAREERNVERF